MGGIALRGHPARTAIGAGVNRSSVTARHQGSVVVTPYHHRWAGPVVAELTDSERQDMCSGHNQTSRASNPVRVQEAG
jgi:hypothetical protein